ncbi:hypothetical protein SB766_19925 [Pseudomonas sp. SIMBA_077]
MRWLFLLLVVLNIFYFVWCQQESPLKAKEVVSLSLYKASKQEIRLLSEAQNGMESEDVTDHESGKRVACFYLSGLTSIDEQNKVKESLSAVGLNGELAAVDNADTGNFVVSVPSSYKAQAIDRVLQSLLNEFNELKYEKKQCQGLQAHDSLHRMAPAPQ